jgi:hypothetical protein
MMPSAGKHEAQMVNDARMSSFEARKRSHLRMTTNFRHPEVPKRSEAEASKGDGMFPTPSFEARKSSHLRMTTLRSIAPN